MIEPKVILVDGNDKEIGFMEKLRAHKEGVLHRAFSVFLFNSEKELLLQQRAFAKYHSGGLWSNTCCSHPEPGQSLESAVNKALQRELGVSCEVKPIGSFIYKKDLGNGLTEHEYDHVFVGEYNGQVKMNPNEVAAIKYVSVQEILNDLKENSKNYTAWFPEAFMTVVSGR